MGSKEAINLLAGRKRKVPLYTRSFFLVGEDGTTLACTELKEGTRMEISVQSPLDESPTAVQLSAAQWKSLCSEIYYDLHCKEEPEFEDGPA